MIRLFVLAPAFDRHVLGLPDGPALALRRAFDLAMYERGLLTISDFPQHRDIHDWFNDVHPIEPAIVIGAGRSASYGADLTELAGLGEPRIGPTAFVALNSAALMHPMRSVLPILWGLDRVVPPLDVASFAVTDAAGEAGWRGRVAQPSAAWEVSTVANSSPAAHMDALAAVIRRVEQLHRMGNLQSTRRSGFGFERKTALFPMPARAGVWA